MAPERDWKPMSYVPPSPPKAMNFHVSSILPRFFMALYAVSTPLMVAPAFSNALWMKLSFHAV
ncbi:hypothetical protein DSECCO2_577620 [anaerobic digester metagenome]